jgi:chromosome segregation ATPase
MRKLVTLISAMALLVGMVIVPAAAADDPVLAELERAIQDAQEVIDDLNDLIDELDADILEAKAALLAATAAYDAQVLVVAYLENERDDAYTALQEAVAVRDDLQEQYDACASGSSGNGCRNSINNGPNGLAAAKAEVDDKQVDYDSALAAFNAGVTRLEELDGAKGEAQETLDGLEVALLKAESELILAEQAYADAVATRDAYLASLENERHEGCNGIEKAVEQVSKGKSNGKGKAAEVLEAKAQEWNCDAA